MRAPHVLALASSVSELFKMSAGQTSLGSLTVNCVSANGYTIEYEDQLAAITKPTLAITGEFTAPARREPPARWRQASRRGF